MGDVLIFLLREFWYAACRHEIAQESNSDQRLLSNIGSIASCEVVNRHVCRSRHRDCDGSLIRSTNILSYCSPPQFTSATSGCSVGTRRHRNPILAIPLTCPAKESQRHDESNSNPTRVSTPCGELVEKSPQLACGQAFHMGDGNSCVLKNVPRSGVGKVEALFVRRGRLPAIVQ